jgi:hypothetical protein
MQAILDFLHMWRLMVAVQLSDATDRTVWRWSEDRQYSARSAYAMLHKFHGHRLIQWRI